MRSSSLGWLSNRYLWIGILVELAGIVSIIYIPYLAKIFNHAPPPGWMWYGLAAYALVLYSIEWIRKTLTRVVRNIRTGKPSTLSLQEVNQ